MTTRQNMRMCFPTSGGLWRFLKNLLPLFFLPLVWVVLFSFFLPLLLPLWILAARVTYDLTRQHDEVLIENALLGMEVGAVLKLADVGIDPAESVCVLPAYYEVFVLDWYPNGPEINQYLLDSKYRSSDGQWALLTIKGDIINLLRFKDKDVDLGSYKTTFPDGFESEAFCVPFEHAALFKSSFKNDAYFFFGRLK